MPSLSFVRFLSATACAATVFLVAACSPSVDCPKGLHKKGGGCVEDETVADASVAGDASDGNGGGRTNGTGNEDGNANGAVAAGDDNASVPDASSTTGMPDGGVEPEGDCFLDRDSDGFGDPETPVACDDPRDVASTGDDCDDGSESSYPGAGELCDGLDNNCDGELDEDFPRMSFFVDDDKDGYGSEESVLSCAMPPGHVSSSTDCNDAAPASNPTAPELCDGIDNDCDDSADEGDAFDCVQGAETACTTSCGTTGSGACTSSCHVPVAAACTAPSETCNAIDDDCSGSKDDGAGMQCILGASVSCATSCGSVGLGACTASCQVPTGVACVPPAETCMPGLAPTDDDCDGRADEGLTKYQGSNKHIQSFNGVTDPTMAAYASAGLLHRDDGAWLWFRGQPNDIADNEWTHYQQLDADGAPARGAVPQAPTSSSTSKFGSPLLTVVAESDAYVFELSSAVNGGGTELGLVLTVRDKDDLALLTERRVYPEASGDTFDVDHYVAPLAIAAMDHATNGTVDVLLVYGFANELNGGASPFNPNLYTAVAAFNPSRAGSASLSVTPAVEVVDAMSGYFVMPARAIAVPCIDRFLLAYGAVPPANVPGSMIPAMRFISRAGARYAPTYAGASDAYVTGLAWAPGACAGGVAGEALVITAKDDTTAANADKTYATRWTVKTDPSIRPENEYVFDLPIGSATALARGGLWYFATVTGASGVQLFEIDYLANPAPTATPIAIPGQAPNIGGPETAALGGWYIGTQLGMLDTGSTLIVSGATKYSSSTSTMGVDPAVTYRFGCL